MRGLKRRTGVGAYDHAFYPQVVLIQIEHIHIHSSPSAQIYGQHHAWGATSDLS